MEVQCSSYVGGGNRYISHALRKDLRHKKVLCLKTCRLSRNYLRSFHVSSWDMYGYISVAVWMYFCFFWQPYNMGVPYFEPAWDHTTYAHPSDVSREMYAYTYACFSKCDLMGKLLPDIGGCLATCVYVPVYVNTAHSNAAGAWKSINDLKAVPVFCLLVLWR